MAAGITFGAYHFARPDLHPFDPVPEADHFVDTAQLAPGNILPVLDLERSGDLSPAELTDWVLGWLGRVTERTGVRPMVYTSPNGWKDRMATPRRSPTPATRCCGSPTGGRGPHAARERLAGERLDDLAAQQLRQRAGHQRLRRPGLVRRAGLRRRSSSPHPDTVAPIATIATPTGVVGPVTVSFDEIVRGVSDESLSLRSLLGVPGRRDDHVRVEGGRAGELRNREAWSSPCWSRTSRSSPG